MINAIKQIVRRTVPLSWWSKTKNSYLQLRYFGFRYKCIFCMSNLSNLLPFGFHHEVLREKSVVGGGYRLHAKCPICGSTDRERLVYLYLKNRTDIFKKEQKLLHVAPETVLSGKLGNQPNLDYLTADLLSDNVMTKMDIANIQFPADTFDSIICNHVLEHVTNDQVAMSELFRVLKPGGWAILQVPISSTLKSTYEDFSVVTAAKREELFGQFDHVRIYGADYKQRLKHAGFSVTEFKWTCDGDEFGGKRNKYGLNSNESIFFARKEV